MHNNGKENLDKFDPRSDEGIFVGYPLLVKLILFTSNVPRSSRNIFTLSLMKLTMVFLVPLYLMSFN